MWNFDLFLDFSFGTSQTILVDALTHSNNVRMEIRCYEPPGTQVLPCQSCLAHSHRFHALIQFEQSIHKNYWFQVE